MQMPLSLIVVVPTHTPVGVWHQESTCVETCIKHIMPLIYELRLSAKMIPHLISLFSPLPFTIITTSQYSLACEIWIPSLLVVT